ncbi:MAG: FAD:protein FMN transferase [Streptosporangiales bacterium]|nr:FAD:protein FMN transferase [Streptosporangiales bacterium]
MSVPSSSTAAASWQALGMLVQIVVAAPDKLPDARELLSADLAELDRACSRFRPDSEVSRLGRTTSGESGLVSVVVSPLLTEAVSVALRAASLTDGDVDPTVGRALSALGYDRDFAQVPPNGPATRPGVGMIPGWREVSVDPAAHRVTLPAGVQLDLGATVKGWAADRSAARIADKLGCGVLVSLGGDTAVSGTPPEGGWRIRVQDVTGTVGAAPAGPVAVIAIRDGGLATSSTAARRWSRGGNVLHHILDPRTAMPAAPIWRTVSVAAASCADANTAATAAVIRGWQAPAWLTSLRLPSRLVETNGTVHTIAGWPE